MFFVWTEGLSLLGLSSASWCRESDVVSRVLHHKGGQALVSASCKEYLNKRGFIFINPKGPFEAYAKSI